jgi:hypothetical protein
VDSVSPHHEEKEKKKDFKDSEWEIIRSVIHQQGTLKMEALRFSKIGKYTYLWDRTASHFRRQQAS